MAARIILLFDFDRTIIEPDSDNWVVDELAAPDLFNRLLPTMPWNHLMGLIVERIQAFAFKKTIIYLGDGKGDFCPMLKLNEGDFVMPRKDFPVWELICENRELVRAEIHKRANGVEYENILLKLLKEITTKEYELIELPPTDCKFEMVSMAQEALPLNLKVHQ